MLDSLQPMREGRTLQKLVQGSSERHCLQLGACPPKRYGAGFPAAICAGVSRGKSTGQGRALPGGSMPSGSALICGLLLSALPAALLPWLLRG